MAWLQTGGTAWTARFAITYDGSASASTADEDVRVAIPEELEEFWDTVDSSGHQIRFTKADGVSLLDHHRVTWVTATRSGLFDILGDSGATSSWGPSAGNVMSLLYLYVGLTGATDISGGSSVTPVTAYLTAEKPRDVILYAREQPDARKPQVRRGKTAAERVVFWIDVTDALAVSQRKYSDRLLYEEVLYCNVSSESAGVAAAIEVETATRFAWFDGRLYIRVTATGGTDGTGYTLKVKFSTTNPDETGEVRALEQRIYLLVRDADDAG